MVTISEIRIKGFKKFHEFEMNFNDNLNIFVGENEAGKSSILEAIRIVLQQKNRNADPAVWKELFCLIDVDELKKTPSIATLPKIIIEIFFNMDSKDKDAEFFLGENYNISYDNERYGVSFLYSYNDELGIDITDNIENRTIPYECYVADWKAFSGSIYSVMKCPVNMLFIDTTGNKGATVFNSYSKNLFNSLCDKEYMVKIKNQFASDLDEKFNIVGLPKPSNDTEFTLDHKKIILENVISVSKDNILLENHGSGMESIIKIKLALNNKNNVGIILLEEPENHLSYTNFRQILNVIKNNNEAQVILTTHSSMIASSLNLRNVIWITNSHAMQLNYVNEDTARFFEKAVNNNFLAFLLSNKIILVEGPTEYLMIPYFYEIITGHTIDEDNISVLSCGGLSYHRYLEIVTATDKKVAVITDNDKKENNIIQKDKFNNAHDNQHIFMGQNIDDWTWEVCLYNLNKDILKEIINVDATKNYELSITNWRQIDITLRKMLLNKVDSAYKIITSEYKL